MSTLSGHILLADDEDTFLEATCDLFQEEGFDCHTAHDANELEQILKGSQDFDILITDLNMPGNRVMELVSTVRSSSQPMPVIVVTGYPSLPTAVESIRLHVLEYFIKPVDFPTLLSAVKKGLQHKEVLQMVHQAQQEAATRAERLAAIEESLQSYNTALVDPAVKEALLTDPQIKELKLHLEGTSRILGSGRVPRSAPTSPSPEDYFRLRESLHDTIQVLHKTKSAFRSKDLASLRLRLENVLRETAESLKSPPLRSDKD
jgi:FixJ family two-component response regulator